MNILQGVAIMFAILTLLMPAGASGQGFTQPAADEGRLQADRVRYDAKGKVFIAEGHVRLVLGEVRVEADRARLEQQTQQLSAWGNVRVAQAETTLVASEVRYALRERLLRAKGQVTVTWQDLAIAAADLTYDLRTESVVAAGGVRLTQGTTVLTAQNLDGDLRAKRADVKGDVTLVRPAGPWEGARDRVAAELAREETTVAAPRMSFRWDVNEARAFDGVTIVQRDKTARAREGVYSEASGRIELEGDVQVEQMSGEWLVKGGLIDAPKDEESKKSLATKVTLTCRRLVVDLKNRNMRGEENVKVVHGPRSATGNRADYRDTDKQLIVTGNVRMQDDEGSLTADRVIISLVEETFEAMGNVETEFRVKRSK